MRQHKLFIVFTIFFLLLLEVLKGDGRAVRSKKQSHNRDRNLSVKNRPRPLTNGRMSDGPSCFLVLDEIPNEGSCRPSLVDIMTILRPCTDQKELSAKLQQVIPTCRFDKTKWNLGWSRVNLGSDGVYSLGPNESPTLNPTTFTPTKKSVMKKVKNSQGKSEEVVYEYEYVYDDPDNSKSQDASKFEEPSMHSVENVLPDNLKDAGKSLTAVEAKELHHLDMLNQEEAKDLERLQKIREKEVEEVEHIEVLKEVEQTEMKLLEKITENILEKRAEESQIKNEDKFPSTNNEELHNSEEQSDKLPMHESPIENSKTSEDTLKDKELKKDEFLYGENLEDEAVDFVPQDNDAPDDVSNEDEIVAMANKGVDDDNLEESDESYDEKENYFVAATNDLTKPEEDSQPSLQTVPNESQNTFPSEDNLQDSSESLANESEALIGTVENKK